MTFQKQYAANSDLSPTIEMVSVAVAIRSPPEGSGMLYRICQAVSCRRAARRVELSRINYGSNGTV